MKVRTSMGQISLSFEISEKQKQKSKKNYSQNLLQFVRKIDK